MAGAAKKPAAAPKAGGAKTATKIVKHKEVKNPYISVKLRKFSKAKVMGMTGSWSFVKDPVEVAKAAKPVPEKTAEKKFIIKKIGGAKNGGERKVLVKKPRKYFATTEFHRTASSFLPRKTKSFRPARASITPGTVLILLGGRHRARRVVFLKQLQSGLLLVTGPYKYNSCPLRRVHQHYVIATSTKLDISGVKFPDACFKDSTYKKDKKKVIRRGNTAKGGDLFEEKKQEYVVSDDRKKLQAEVDKQILDIVLKNADAEVLKTYLKTPFALQKRMFPHALKF